MAAYKPTKVTKTHKWCNKCKKNLLHKHFSKCKTEKFNMSVSCRKCNSVEKRQRRLNGRPERNKEQERAHNLKSNYGLTVEEYDVLLEKQGRGCAVCGSLDSKTTRTKYLFVDHCHKTGEIRGLLCHKCNVALGLFEDNIEVLEKATAYLRAI